MNQKAVFWSKNIGEYTHTNSMVDHLRIGVFCMKVITCTNFVGGHLIKKKKMENWRFCKFLYVTIAVYFMSFESTVRYITIHGVQEMDMCLKKL